MSGLYLLRAGGFVSGSLAVSYLYYVTIVQRIRDDHANNMARIEACETRLHQAAEDCEVAVRSALAGTLKPATSNNKQPTA